MRPQEITITGNGSTVVTSDPIRMNYRQNAYKLGIQGIPESGVTYALTPGGNITFTNGIQFQYTMLDPADFLSIADYNTALVNSQSIWITLTGIDSITAAGATSHVGNIVIPVQAIRVRIGSAETGTVTTTILQGNAW